MISINQYLQRSIQTACTEANEYTLIDTSVVEENLLHVCEIVRNIWSTGLTSSERNDEKRKI